MKSNGRHLSFDFWNTLASANPTYTEARTAFLARISEASDPKLVARLYTAVKRTLDSRAEEFGEGMSVERCVRLLVNTIDPTAVFLKPLEREIMKTFNDLFRMFPPIVLPETVDMLRDLRGQGYSISIASNTNFIAGAVLRETALEPMNLDWRYMLFSDEEGFSKPHPQFFSRVIGMSSMIPSQITHIGDNHVCDGGATLMGMETFLIANPLELTERIYQLTEKHKQ